jgi:putative spermidine/putrescine transport system ATP-binding protein
MRKRPKAEIEKRAKDALALVGLADYAKRQPRELSGGQQQRVALARALVFEPDVLLLDEPLGALDKNLREHMQVEIKRLHRDIGITMVYVTHDQSEAMTMSDRIAVFSHGIVEQFAAPLDVYLKPATRFVAGFVGDSNFFTAGALGPNRVQIDGVGEAECPLPQAGVNDRFHVLVRPEAIAVLPPGREAGPDHCAIAITVSGIVHYGDSVLVLAQHEGQELRARLPFAQAFEMREGDRLHFAWRRRDMHFIPV